MSRRSLVIFSAVAVLILAAALPSPAQRTQPNPAPNRAIYALAGAVWDDATQQRLENVRVELKTSSGEVVNTTFTGSNGDFEFTGLGNGEYFVEVNLADYESFRESVIIENSPRRGVSVFLRKTVSVGVKPVTTNGTISAHQLSVPAKAREAFDKGITLLYVKANFHGAIEQFDRAIKAFPDYYEAYSEKGSALAFLNDRPGAEATYRASIEISKNKYPEAMFLLAGLLNDDDKYSEAEPLVRGGLAQDSTSWRGHLELARTLVGLKQPDEAEQNATQARTMKPDEPAVYLVLANIHIQKQDGKALLDDLDGYLKVAPNGPAAEQARKTRDQLQASLQKNLTEPEPAPPAPSQQ